jgi:PAS domain S-box-containing protein
LAGPSVLLVHDSPIYTGRFCIMLSGPEFTVRTTSSGAEALKIVRQHRTDLIVSDVVMSGMDGVQLCRELKSDPRTSEIPVLLVTALRYDDEGVIDGLKAGAVDYLSSGAPGELLRRKCAQLISERREKQARLDAEAALKTAYAELESRVEQRTAELARANALLEQEAAERARAEKALRESEERFRRTFEEAPIGMALMSTDFKFIKVNKKLCQMLGYSEHEFAELTLAKITDPADLEGHLELARQVFMGERASYDIEKRYIRKNGETLWANLTATVVRGQDGRVLYKLGMMEDISEAKKMQEQLIQSEKLSALGQLVAGVAHELNNPLTSVIGYSQLTLANPAVDESLKLQLETIHKEGERARRIIQNLLSFARQHKPGRTQTDINELLRGCLDLRLYSHTSNNVSVRRQLSDVPPVLADPHQLQQVFLNIIINAEQAILSVRPEGGLVVSTSAKEQDGRCSVEIMIADDGPGIPLPIIGKVFDPFFTTKEVGQGTGLGLSISYGIIKEHAGKIRVESQVGKGASFFIELPAADDQGALDC